VSTAIERSSFADRVQWAHSPASARSRPPPVMRHRRPGEVAGNQLARKACLPDCPTRSYLHTHVLVEHPMAVRGSRMTLSRVVHGPRLGHARPDGYPRPSRARITVWLPTCRRIRVRPVIARSVQPEVAFYCAVHGPAVRPPRSQAPDRSRSQLMRGRLEDRYSGGAGVRTRSRVKAGFALICSRSCGIRSSSNVSSSSQASSAASGSGGGWARSQPSKVNRSSLTRAAASESRLPRSSGQTSTSRPTGTPGSQMADRNQRPACPGSVAVLGAAEEFWPHYNGLEYLALR
jgi:hypothetical protein